MASLPVVLRAPPRPPTRPLNHLAFAVPDAADLDAWADRLAALGVAHSGVKPLPGFGHVIERRATRTTSSLSSITSEPRRVVSRDPSAGGERKASTGERR